MNFHSYTENSDVCVECGSDDFVVDRTTCDEICRGCGVVRQTVLFSDDFGFEDSRRMQTTEEELISKFSGTEYYSRGGGVDKPKGVSSRVVECCSKNEITKHASMLEKISKAISSRCHARTGIMLNVRSTALEVFDVFFKLANSARTKTKITGRNAEVYAAACLYIAAKIERCERTDVEIQNLFGVTPKRFSSAFSDIVVALVGHPLHSRIASLSRPLSVTPRVIDLLGDGVDEETRRNMRRIADGKDYEEAERELVDGGASGNVVAGALLHLASGKKATLEELSKIFGYTPSIIKTVVKRAEIILEREKSLNERAR